MSTRKALRLMLGTQVLNHDLFIILSRVSQVSSGDIGMGSGTQNQNQDIGIVNI